MKTKNLFCMFTALGFCTLSQVSLCACSSDENSTLFSTHLPKEEQSAAIAVPMLLPEPGASPVSGILPSDAPPEHDTIKMHFVGDVMLAAENGDDGFWSFNLFAYDTPKAYYFEKMFPLFSSDDWTVANGENVFTDAAHPEKIAKKEDPAFWYYSKTENAQIYSAGSVEIVSLANNHAMDYGVSGRDDTKAAIEAAGAMCVLDGTSVTLEKSGVTVALLCTSMYSEYYLTPILDWLTEAQKKLRLPDCILSRRHRTRPYAGQLACKCLPCHGRSRRRSGAWQSSTCTSANRNLPRCGYRVFARKLSVRRQSYLRKQNHGVRTDA